MRIISPLFARLSLCLMIFSFDMGVAVAQVVQPPGLVAWWTADANTVDIVGGHNGALKNGATFGPDRFGQANRAFRFDGVDDFVLVPHSPDLYGGATAPMTVAAWVFRGSSDPLAHILGIRPGCDSKYPPA